MKILHIIARWIGGGPERGILEAARHDASLGTKIERRILVLDKPISAPLFAMARRLNIAVLAPSSADQVDVEIAAADVVEITYWNHPLLLNLLRRPLPSGRYLIRSAIAGNTLPHVLFPALVDFADTWILSAPAGHGACHLHHVHHHVTNVPALADMSRLSNFVPRQHDGLRITYLGSLLPTKLHPEFVEIVAASHISGAHFDLYGDADAVTMGSLRSLFDARGVSDRISLHGHVESIDQAFSNADIFAYPLAPGSYVTSEKALQEAMWVGLPAILLEGTAATGWIEDGVTGFIARDIADFTRILARLAADPLLRQSVGQAARLYARLQFDPSQNAKVMLQLLIKLTEQPKRKKPPIPGANLSAADRFLQSLGEAATDFLKIVEDGIDNHSLSTTCNLQVLLRGEGGIIHYINTYPEDDKLKQWADALGYVQHPSSMTHGIPR